MGDDLLKEIVKLLILKGATSAWRDDNIAGAFLLFGIYGALSNK